MHLFNFVYYLHWTLMALVGITGLMLVFKPNNLARIYMIAFLGQQLILNGCIMTMWENKVKASMGYPPHKNEFIMAHVVGGFWVILYKVAFGLIVLYLMYSLLENNGKQKTS